VRAGGGPQAGHTVTSGVKVTQVPSGLINKQARLLIGRGTVINPEIVLQEIYKYGLTNRIGIDYGCTVIEKKHIEAEQELVKRIGSVGTGVGPARADRILRRAKLAKDVPELKPYLTDVAEEVNEAALAGKKVLVEGVQGFRLSLLDHKSYPYVTSQDTTASQFAVDVGIGPRLIDEVTIVFKAYITRVGQGPLENEWSVEKIKELGIEEKGTVSGRPRRAAPFDKEIAKKAIIRNTATQAVVTCIDRLFPGNTSVKDFHNLTEGAQEFVREIDEYLKGMPFFKGVTLISTGPNSEDMIDLRK